MSVDDFMGAGFMEEEGDAVSTENFLLLSNYLIHKILRMKRKNLTTLTTQRQTQAMKVHLPLLMNCLVRPIT